MTANMVRSLMAHWRNADTTMRADGMAWYRNARRTAYQMSRDNNCTMATAAGVLAALSPRLQWSINVKAAARCLARQPVTGVFRASLTKAEAIRDGATPLSVLGGTKVRSFYRAIMGDESSGVVDIWMIRAVNFGGKLTEVAYQRIVKALQIAAKRVRTTVAQLQAVVWSVVRGRAV